MHVVSRCWIDQEFAHLSHLQLHCAGEEESSPAVVTWVERPPHLLLHCGGEEERSPAVATWVENPAPLTPSPPHLQLHRAGVIVVPGLEGDDYRGGELPCRGNVGGEFSCNGGVVWFQGHLLVDLTQSGGQGNVEPPQGQLIGISEEDILGVGEPAASCGGQRGRGVLCPACPACCNNIYKIYLKSRKMAYSFSGAGKKNDNGL